MGWLSDIRVSARLTPLILKLSDRLTLLSIAVNSPELAADLGKASPAERLGISRSATEVVKALAEANDYIDEYVSSSGPGRFATRPESLFAFDEELEMMLSETAAVVESFVSELARWIRDEGFRIEWTKLRTASAVEQIQSSAEQIKKTERDVAVAAGTVATGSLAVAFESYTTAQAVSARWWMSFSVIAVAAVVVVGVLLLRAPDPTWQQTVAHLVIALPTAGVAAYGARESSRHRESSQWAQRVAAQLKVIGPYVDRLPESEQNALWTGFGRYIFGPYAAAPVENQLQAVPPELLKALTDLVNASK